MMMSKGFLCSFLCLSSYIAASAALGRQGDALHKLFSHSTKLQKDASSQADTFLSDPSSKLYNNDGLKEKDKIVKLPGQPHGVDFDQYAGYVTVDGHTGRALFYYFAEAVGRNSSSKPLLLWLNGGPGCSSWVGAMEELGPFRVMSDGKTLYRNPYAWNTVANVLFLESPAGVGFSYSNTTSDYRKSGDKRTAEDSYVFLLNWMERFPEYKGREFYIAGESYAGHYVPQLAYTILQHKNRSSSATASINLKGIAIGNAAINDETDNIGVADFLWTHAMISDATVEAIHKFCNFTPGAVEERQECLQAFKDAGLALGNINIYNIYAPLCFSTGVTAAPMKPSIDNYDPCSDNYVYAYLNDPGVQKALHANVTKLNYSWIPCSIIVQELWMDSPYTILPIIRHILTSGLRVLVYSGDIDGRIPVTSTKYSLNVLKLPVKVPWRAWTSDLEVGGYTMVYDKKLTFATVRGAGHEVPSYQPSRALMLIKSFIQGLQLPP